MGDKLIHIEEYVSINGINQYLFHSGTNYDNPVMLFLHGGPGNAQSLFAYMFQEKWERIFTIVHWDQRGTGKTLIENKDKYPTINLMLEDLFEVVQYLKRKHNKEKIIILGHSWGSVLGSIFIRQYPGEVSYYIGVGQVINMIENERVGYEKVKKLIIQSNNKKDLKKLKALGKYPEDNFDDNFIKKCIKVRKLQGKYNLAINISLSTFRAIFKSPILKFSDIFALIKGNKANRKILKFLFQFDLNSQSKDYRVPIYYIFGDGDWQTPYVIAQEYFNRINAPYKKFYLIPNAGHMTMIDQSQLFFETLLEIKAYEDK